MRTLRRVLDEIDIVQLPQGFQIAVPRWMFDPLICSQLPQEAKPRVGLSALLRLAEFFDKQRLLVSDDVALSDTSPSTKGHHVSRQKPLLSSSPVAPAQEDALGSLPGSNAGPVSSSAHPTVAPSGAEHLQGKEQP